MEIRGVANVARESKTGNYGNGLCVLEDEPVRRVFFFFFRRLLLFSLFCTAILIVSDYIKERSELFDRFKHEVPSKGTVERKL